MQIRTFTPADTEAVKLLAMGCPKLNVLVRSTNKQVVAFYQKLAYQADDVLSLGKRLVADQ